MTHENLKNWKENKRGGGKRFNLTESKDSRERPPHGRRIVIVCEGWKATANAEKARVDASAGAGVRQPGGGKKKTNWCTGTKARRSIKKRTKKILGRETFLRP